ncbi:ABC-type multidrug transport system, ATPase and permease component [Geosmithia morbida]|uniref:ABC-type multidrug transport system, ATPase and permease component n=1 Tax=Geosmithia morbida TaxID=1094350 RepID=A0A9P4YXV4_9HYPO|nr:ABC-type multidrug transport system, ATPase and permease component [Geosmithia morbida]KAF4125093.1 ABC-type multidrug transport system, ATPase and permease component [Geosmithia morbida]
MGYNPFLLSPSASALVLTSLSSIPAIAAVVDQIRKGAPKDNFYEDRDGESTPEAIAAFSNKASKITVLASALLGLVTSAAISVLTTLDADRGDQFLENWLTTAAWVLIVTQSVSMSAIHEPVRVHDLGLWSSMSSVVLLSVLILQAFTVSAADKAHRCRNDAVLGLRLTNIAMAVVILFASVLIPRRPHVFFRDALVDPQRTSSLLNRFTWTWTGPILDLAAKKGDLESKDIPQPDHTIRTENVMADWKAYNFKGKLIWSILYAYRWRFATQWTVTVSKCILGVGPFWVMRKLINILQERGGGGSPPYTLWVLVISLGLLGLIEQWMDGWIQYYSTAMIAQPLRAQLSALVYEKSLRRKNVKSADKPKTTEKIPGGQAGDSQEASNSAAHGADSGDGSNRSTAIKDKANDEKDESASDEDSSVLKSRQAIVNLVGVDARHVASFAGIQYYIISSLGKLLILSAFLIQILGWIPFVTGITAWGLSLPFNTFAAKSYLRFSEAVMKVRDEKLAIVNEALLGIRQIKFAALEPQWEKRIMEMRDKELEVTWKMFLSDTCLFGCWIASPILLAATSLATYAIIHGELSPSTAFVSISVFKSLELALGAMPEILTTGFDTLVSIRRIDTYLSGPEMKQAVSEGSDVAFENATIAWPVDEEVDEEDRFTLSGLDLLFPPGELSVVSGKTGTGKSLILSALIGEADVLGGRVVMPLTVPPLERHDDKANASNWILPGSVAYVAQTPWLESASLRDNILFGLPMDETRYNKVLAVCALRKDLQILTEGDKTELGANGVNLSGGQKWRITLARAIYSRAGILIMDDIFSAVDAHVGRHIFEECIGGDICKGRTRILVTHHVGLVQPLAKFIVELGDDGVLYSGSTEQLIEDGTLEKIKRMESPLTAEPSQEIGESSMAVSSDGASTQDSANDDNAVPKTNGLDDAQGKKYVQEETRQTGNVKSRVYLAYLKACGGLSYWILCFSVYLAFETLNLARAWWVKVWTSSHRDSSMVVNSYDEHDYVYGLSLQQPRQSAFHAFSSPVVAQSDNGDLKYYLGIYVGLSVIGAIVGTSRFFWSFYISLKGSRVLFSRILHTVLRTRIRWLDTVPVGRILNRLTSDFEIIDQRLALDMGLVAWQAFSLSAICIAGALVSPYILPLSIVLIATSIFIGKKYLNGARPLKRLESTTKSPVFELFNATLSGITTLRAFQKPGTYVDTMYKDLDLFGSVSVYMLNASRWLGFRMAIIGTTFTTIVGIVVILSHGINAALAGFILSFSLDFAFSMSLAIRIYSNLELDMNATERVIEYAELETEAQDGVEPPAAWPTSGSVEVKNLEVAYGDGLPLVLKGISFDVKDGERIGVVGRTGAGKSSLTLALFRFLEARSGSIIIDGLDISKLDLHALRSRLAIIPQDPVLFSGTIRSNLDPFEERSDSELREALARVHLVDSASSTPTVVSTEPSSSAAASTTLLPQNTNIFRDLSSPISESGGNLSQGQRQLLCLARAIVSLPRVMVLDEATSAVDMSTDALIQRSIREEFTGSTLIVIAHRLSTIADFDRILVLSEGQSVECGTPRELWEREGSIFRDMCDSSGEKDKLREKIF